MQLVAGLTNCGKPGDSAGVRKLLDRFVVNPPDLDCFDETLPDVIDGWPMLWAFP